MTEHALQKRLTAHWSRHGIVLGSGEHLRLVAWEVMAPSWRINDAHLGWGEPALDFLAVDGHGRPVAIELKRRLTGRLDASRAVCQVIHMTLMLAQTANLQKMRFAWGACYSGRHGRSAEGLADAEPHVTFDAGWRRVVAAPVLDSHVVVEAAERVGVEDPPAAARAWLSQRADPEAKTDTVVRRLASLTDLPYGVLAGPVESYRVLDTYE